MHPSSGGAPPRCDLCNTELVPTRFTQLPCLHRFCVNCTTGVSDGHSMMCALCINTGQLSALQLSSIKASLLLSSQAPSTSATTTSTPIPSSFFTDFTSTDPPPPLTVDTSSFFLWDTPPSLPQPPSTAIIGQQQQQLLLRRPPSQSDVPSSFSPKQHLPPSSTAGFSLAPPLPPSLGYHQRSPTMMDSPSSWSQRKSPALCSNCSDGIVATSRCEQCTELLCVGCVAAHFRVRITRDHRVVPIAMPTNIPSPAAPTTIVPSSSSSPPLTHCAFHDALLLFTCATCTSSSRLCAYCLPDHRGHNLIQIGGTQLDALVAESRRYQRALDEGAESVRRMAERVDASMQAAVSDIRSIIHAHISALEERKRELLERCDAIRKEKMAVLKTQSECICARLATMTHILNQVDDDPTMVVSGTIYDALMAQLQDARCHLSPHETDHVRLVISGDDDLLARIRHLGDIECGACARTSHIVGDACRRAIRDRVTSVVVQARDANGDACKTGGELVSAHLIAPDASRYEMTMHDALDGTYYGSWTASMDGIYVLHVSIRGCPIAQSPMSIHVRKGRNYAELVGSKPLFSFGGEGEKDGQLCRPWGICCDRRGRIIVADRSNNRIQIFDKNGKFLLKFGSSGTRAGQFDRPAGVAVNGPNQIIVADKDNHRIQIFSENGEFKLKFGERGRSVSMFNYPWDVACNSSNEIAVSDTRNHRVQIFASNGQFLRKFGFDNSLFFKHLDSPRGLCYLPDGQLLITDFNHHRLAIAASPTAGTDIKFFGREGDADGQFRRPQGIDVDAEGHVIVCDSRNNRLQVLAPDDLHPLCTFGAVDEHNPWMDRPTDVCVAPDGRLYVVDLGHNCVHVF